MPKRTMSLDKGLQTWIIFSASGPHNRYTRTYHTKEVSGNAKHAQRSMEDNVLGFCEATSQFLNFSTESKLPLFAMKMQLAASDPEERTQDDVANIRG